MTRAATGVALLFMILCPASATAQSPDSVPSRGDCAATGALGLRIDVGPGPARPAREASPSPYERTSLDTTYTFDVAERRWTRPALAASVAAGTSGTDRTGAPWHACAGARVVLEGSMLVIRGARGVVRLHVALDALAAAGRGAASATSRR